MNLVSWLLHLTQYKIMLCAGLVEKDLILLNVQCCCGSSFLASWRPHTECSMHRFSVQAKMKMQLCAGKTSLTWTLCLFIETTWVLPRIAHRVLWLLNLANKSLHPLTVFFPPISDFLVTLRRQADHLHLNLTLLASASSQTSTETV